MCALYSFQECDHCLQRQLLSPNLSITYQQKTFDCELDGYMPGRKDTAEEGVDECEALHAPKYTEMSESHSKNK